MGTHQKNKSFKGKGTSKKAMKRITKGKVPSKRPGAKVKDVAGVKLERVNQSKQLMAKRRAEAQRRKRAVGGDAGAPKVVSIVALDANVDTERIKAALVKQCDATAPCEAWGPTTVCTGSGKQRVTFLNTERHIFNVLDAVKVADVVLFVVSAEGGIDDMGVMTLSALRGQGIVTALGLVTQLDSVPKKKRGEVRKAHTKALHEELGDSVKVLAFDSESEQKQAVRFLTNIKTKELVWRAHMPYMLVQELAVEPAADTPPEEQLFTVHVSGYVRGAAFNANKLVHFPDCGDFQISQIATHRDPCPLRRAGGSGSNSSAMDAAPTEGVVLQRVDPEQCMSLRFDKEPDAFAAEQTWPTEEEILAAERERAGTTAGGTLRPKGMSDYQAAWIEGEDLQGGGGGEGDDAMGGASGSGSGMGDEGGDGDEDEPEELEWVGEDGLSTLQRSEEKKRLELAVRSKEDMEFPDEVDTPVDKLARIRFQKYRGLKSFRLSPWDPKENLPRSYARIYEFENFASHQRRTFQDHTGVGLGQYVTISVLRVPAAMVERMQHSNPLVMCGLMDFENKLTVVHYLVQRSRWYDGGVKSKEPLLMQCGFRRFESRPIYSQDTKGGDKHKMERFLQPGQFVVATVFAPAVFQPCPVLMFKEEPNDLHLVATGSVHSVDPNRIVVKRIVLTGYPFKVHKSRGVVRYMFFNADDIRYFKPVELWTKFGRRGNIMEPVGTHGYMKCQFDGVVKQDDTVCMALYKRVYPPSIFDDDE